MFSPELTMNFAHYCALLIGLHHRHFFSTSSWMLQEALQLPDLPVGFDPIVHFVLSGELSDHDQNIEACETLWAGIVNWAFQHHYLIQTEHIPF